MLCLQHNSLDVCLISGGLHILERDLGLQCLQREVPLEVSPCPKVWEFMDLPLHDLPKATATMIAMVTAIILLSPKAFQPKVRDRKDEDHHQIQAPFFVSWTAFPVRKNCCEEFAAFYIVRKVMKFHLHLLQ